MVLLHKEKRAKTVSERIFHAGENSRVFVSTDLILALSIFYFSLFLSAETRPHTIIAREEQIKAGISS